jgi:hypothetical protein
LIVRVLREPQQGLVWRSTLTGSRYRWGPDYWETSTALVPEWHAAYLLGPDTIHVIYPHSNEYFEEVDAAAD